MNCRFFLLGVGALCTLFSCAPSNSQRTQTDLSTPAEEETSSQVVREIGELPGYDPAADWFAEAPDEVVDNASVLVETPATVDEVVPPDISDDLAAETKALLPSIDELFDYPVVINRRVLTWIDQYTGKYKNSFNHNLERSGRFLPMARQIFAEEGIPQDLAFLAHIESGFRTNARSHKRALGLWQFLRGTAEDYGLRCDTFVDERMDPEKSTRAAARFLRDLHGRYDDWLLALAAYNAGPGNVDKAIRAAGSKSFWDIAKTKHLLTETENFVPAILAATILAKSPAAYGLTEDIDPPFTAEAVLVERPTSLTVISQLTGLTVEELREYNPDLLQGTTPPTHVGYALHLPPGYAAATGRALASLPEDQRILYSIHRVSSGETLGQIARLYGTTVRQIQMVNRMGNSTRIKAGQELDIPTLETTNVTIRSDSPELEGNVHIVSSGENLYNIARRYGTTVEEIQYANGIADARRIHPGQELAIPGGSGAPLLDQSLASIPTIVPDPFPASARSDSAAEMGRVHSTAHLVEEFRAAMANGTEANFGTPTARRDEARLSGRAANSPNRASNDAESGPRTGEKGPNWREGSAEDQTGSGWRTQDAAPEFSEFHVVQSGETLSTIASRHFVTVTQLREWNGLGRSSLIRPGQRLTLVETNRGDSASAETEGDSPFLHVVEKGESLWRIAKNYGVKVADIMQWNRLRSQARIYPGQKLKILF